MLFIADLIRSEDLSRNTGYSCRSPTVPISLVTLNYNTYSRSWTMSKSYRARERIQPGSQHPHEPPQPILPSNFLPARPPSQLSTGRGRPSDHREEVIEHAMDLEAVN
jgi:hypothetical protein